MTTLLMKALRTIKGVVYSGSIHMYCTLGRNSDYDTSNDVFLRPPMCSVNHRSETSYEPGLLGSGCVRTSIEDPKTIVVVFRGRLLD